jgi:hypothetical protein
LENFRKQKCWESEPGMRVERATFPMGNYGIKYIISFSLSDWLETFYISSLVQKEKEKPLIASGYYWP